MTPRQILSTGPVIPVIALDDPQTALGLAQALIDGGIRVLEITLRTPAALEAISLIRREIPAAIVGAGTVINAAQLAAVTEAGAKFAISPGISEPFARAAAAAAIPVIPGVSGAGGIMLALEYGLDTVKLFPAEAVGGIKMLKALHGPFPQVRFCPTGGIAPAAAPDYLALPNVLCVGGSWLTPPQLIAGKNWHAITELAAQAARLQPAKP
ncbi:MAG: bifunctional 4-hydroxy-2-oxoglutarate aldolase/2-dehydro-3-deoxy-phosphogluconate aldolase [Neisseria sp.]|nr:bifunctional 4-hydroxy-2-oxoglutarate aldolase/2-dehydro-3-deoxy-phosphogluconate aldolase [Neisseria sp.]